MIDGVDLRIEDVLKEKGFVAAHPKGISMRPFLRANDTIILKTIDGDVKTGDPILFKRSDGVYVLHRVVAVNGDRILTRGDFEKKCDAPITRADVLAILTEYYSGRKHVFTDDPKYIRKITRWNGKGRKRRVALRRFVYRSLSFVKRLPQKLFKRKNKDNEKKD